MASKLSSKALIVQPPALVFQVARGTGMNHHTHPAQYFQRNYVYLKFPTCNFKWGKYQHIMYKWKCFGVLSRFQTGKDGRDKWVRETMYMTAHSSLICSKILWIPDCPSSLNSNYLSSDQNRFNIWLKLLLLPLRWSLSLPSFEHPPPPDPVLRPFSPNLGFTSFLPALYLLEQRFLSSFTFHPK